MKITPDRKDDEQYDHLKTGRSDAAIKGMLWSGINATLPALTGFLVFTITSRYLQPAQFGLVALATSIVTLAGALAPAGFGDALVQYKNVERRHLDTVFWLCLATALAAYVVLLLLSWPLALWFKEAQLMPLLAVLGTRLIFDLMGAVPNALLARSMSFRLVARRTAVASAVSAIVCLSLLFLGFGLWALALSQLVSSVTSCLAAALSVKWRPRWPFDPKSFNELRRFGMFSSGNRFITLLSVDQLAIGSFLGPAALGYYSFARRIFQTIVQLISGALGSVSNSLMASLQGEKVKLRRVFLIATFASSAISFPLFAGLAAVARDLVPLAFGPQWVDAVPVLQCFCAIGLISCIGVLQASLINSQGRADWWMFYQIAQQVSTLLIIVITYRFGVTVLIVGIAIKTWLTWPLTAQLTIRLLDIGWKEYLRPFAGVSLSTFLMVAGVVAMHEILLSHHVMVRLLIEIATGSIIYAGAIFISARSSIREVTSVIRRKKI